ncbi:MAG: SEC-C motif-containing protein [Candidatus Kentron sp. G]|nr:MAG: SEC-C motif-containing protein [Candidatus Kentron sp. G]VFM96597.1 MAG: SEC-C motif-containing protein [Candidatus Kentron sp. G]VFM98672.1 MAG: SEC-C motif-containing protein [Candidatus Kentron sp. G]
MTIEEILAGLKYKEQSFPREALAEAIAHREEITPELLKIIEYSAGNIETLRQEEKQYFAHIYAMYLLAQFRETRAYEPIIAFFSAPEEIIEPLVEDDIFADLDRIFASVYNGDVSLLKGLIENENADESARSSAIEALTTLVAFGEQTREDMIGYFRTLFNAKLDRKGDLLLWDALVLDSTRLYPEELYGEIKAAIDDGLVEDFFMSLEDVDDYLEEGKEVVLGRLKGDPGDDFIEDTIGELEEWLCFRTPEKQKRIDAAIEELSAELSAELGASKQPRPARRDSYVPYVRQTEKVGRNDPCPCGSGKKYKKCCLNN